MSKSSSQLLCPNGPTREQLKNEIYKQIAKEVELESGWMQDAPTVASWIRRHITDGTWVEYKNWMVPAGVKNPITPQIFVGSKHKNKNKNKNKNKRG